jgi:hypothetical protein
VQQWTAISHSSGASAFVYARDEQEALLARRALEQAAARTGAFRVVSAEQLLALGGDRRAWFGLQAEPGYALSNGTRPPMLRAARERAIAGSLTAEAGTTTGFVLWGRGARTGVRIPRMRETDVAPTLAALLGLRFAAADGRVIVGALDVPLPAETAP